ncbi:hypothetical protein C7N43_20885 [Sphingobacteriales bacterium UPWRP_1]|nr:hypothetical protein BVG80_15760 [Sphingobacteriales bacterium TSM_CSM]PSJ75039.1 hypothetical protein C7N43_20885 [Sphingobacteriales bacterium UPWRP_1]
MKLHFWFPVVFFIVCITHSAGSRVMAQIPVEIFGGHKKATLDIMFFKFFKTPDAQNSKWLFFNRNRSAIDYQMNTQTGQYLPQFGFTEAVSYNLPALKGLAPVAVASILNRGVYPKAGVQFAKIGKNYTIFSWTVAELLKNPNVDFFFLARFTPSLSQKLNLFSQIELVNAFPSVNQNPFSFTQRYRLGLKVKAWQLGAGADFSQNGRKNWVKTNNLGGFLRYEF